MKNENYINIQGWMVKELKLSGNDLICYALIYGFTQNGCYWDKSSAYISNWLGVSKRAVVDILKRLVDNKLIEKYEYEVNGVRFCKYRHNANVINFIGSEESAQRGSEESSPYRNNINDVNKEEIKENKKRKKETTEPTDDDHTMFEDFRKKYKGKKRGHDTEFNFFITQNKDWKEILPKLIYAVDKENLLREQARMSNKFFPEPKNMQTYLGAKNKGWEIYLDDFEKRNTNEYIPQCDGISLMWNDVAKCYLTPFDITTLSDGYTKDNRPDGAIVMWRGYRYKWSNNKQIWECE